ncbi:hypothetical protein HYW41_03035 [Candidatus Daviesbacteria bacterium]|nr:hypothetical protein [Candidatus Daviesbacteria bacterium]
MKKILLSAVNILVIFNLLFYQLAPALIHAQEEPLPEEAPAAETQESEVPQESVTAGEEEQVAAALADNEDDETGVDSGIGIIDVADAVTGAPAEVIEAVVDGAESVVDGLQGLGGTVQQAFDNSDQEGILTRRAEELEAEEQARLEAQRLAVEEALNRSPEERSRSVAQALELPEDTSAEQVVNELNNLVNQTGIKIEGDPSSLVLTQVSLTEDELVEQVSLALTLPPVERDAELERIKQQVLGGTEFVANLVTQDFYNLFKHTTDLQFNDLPRIEGLKIQAGFDDDYIRNNTADYLRQTKDLQKLTSEQLEQQIQGLYTYLAEDEANRATEQLRAKKEYADALKEVEQKARDLQQEAQITGALALAGYIPVDQLAAPAIKRVAQSVETRTGLLIRAQSFLGQAGDFANGLFGRGTNQVAETGTRTALSKAEPVFAMPARVGESVVAGTFGIRADSVAGPLYYSREVIPRAASLSERLLGPHDIINDAADQQVKQAVENLRRIYPDEYASPEKAAEAEAMLRGALLGKLQAEREMAERLIADWVYREVPEGDIYLAMDASRRLNNFLLTPGASLKNLPDDLRYAFNAGVYDSRVESGLSTVVGMMDTADSILTQQYNASRIQNQINTSSEILLRLKEYALSNGADDISFRNLHRVADPKSIHIVTAADMQRYSPDVPAGGLFLSRDQQILLREEAADRVGVLAHECIHRACSINRLDDGTTYQAMVQALGGQNLEQGENNYSKLAEGLTQWTLTKGRELAGVVDDAGPGYIPQVAAVEEIVTTIQKNARVSRERAEAIVIEAQVSGYYGKLHEPLGHRWLGPIDRGSDKQVGNEILRDILDRTPKTTSNVDYRQPKPEPSTVITPANIGRATVAVGGAGVLGYLSHLANQAVHPIKESDKNPSRRLLPMILVKPVYAQGTISQNQMSSLSDFEQRIRVQLVKDALKANGEVNQVYLENAARVQIFAPQVLQITDGFAFVTGEAGSSEGQLPAGTYLVDVSALANTEISVPQSVEIGEKAVTIAVGIREGSGNVKKIRAENTKNSLVAYAAEQKGKQSVKVLTYYDENGNGKWDKSEHSVPWAGVQVELKNMHQDKLVSLLSGWNLVTLTAVPSKPLTASGLVTEIAKQEGYATTISTLENGSWKSFVQRGDKKYTGEDFVIEPGKAYFVKALKRSAFLYQGQEFVAPIKLNLDSGWNGVGIPFSQKDYKASDFKAEVAARWESGAWDAFVKLEEEYGNNFPIENDRGYIVKVGQNTEFKP